MERYGHDSPPKVMWGVDDDIRKLFRAAEAKLKELPDVDLEEFSKSFEAFSEEFEAMIFKEEAILLMILLETFTQDDWLSIAEESDAYGYAIIKPTAVWKPKRERFEEVNADTSQEQSELSSDEHLDNTRIIDTPEGQFTISFTPKPKTETVVDRETTQPFGNGYLSVEQANLILNHLPLEITFVNKDDIFQYYNDNVPANEWYLNEHLAKLDETLNFVIRQKCLIRSRKSLNY